jgi:hypothetical protein
VPVSHQLPDLTGHWVGFAALAIFAAAYALVIAEEAIDLRKSKPVVVALIGHCSGRPAGSLL